MFLCVGVGRFFKDNSIRLTKEKENGRYLISSAATPIRKVGWAHNQKAGWKAGQTDGRAQSWMKVVGQMG